VLDAPAATKRPGKFDWVNLLFGVPAWQAFLLSQNGLRKVSFKLELGLEVSRTL